MKKQINIWIKRLFGKVTIYSKSSEIKGYYSEGRRDIGGQDWAKVLVHRSLSACAFDFDKIELAV
jgi:hypothetical protein